jgi:hypothetical protein
LYCKETYGAGDKTSLTLNEYDLALFYGIPFVGVATLGRLNVDIGLNLRLIEVEAEMKSSLQSEIQKETIPLPMVFVAAQFKPIDIIALEAEIRALSVGDADVVSVLARLRYNSLGPLFFFCRVSI